MDYLFRSQLILLWGNLKFKENFSAVKQLVYHACIFAFLDSQKNLQSTLSGPNLSPLRPLDYALLWRPCQREPKHFFEFMFHIVKYEYISTDIPQLFEFLHKTF